MEGAWCPTPVDNPSSSSPITRARRSRWRAAHVRLHRRVRLPRRSRGPRGCGRPDVRLGGGPTNGPRLPCCRLGSTKLLDRGVPASPGRGVRLLGRTWRVSRRTMRSRPPPRPRSHACGARPMAGCLNRLGREHQQSCSAQRRTRYPRCHRGDRWRRQPSEQERRPAPVRQRGCRLGQTRSAVSCFRDAP